MGITCRSHSLCCLRNRRRRAGAPRRTSSRSPRQRASPPGLISSAPTPRGHRRRMRVARGPNWRRLRESTPPSSILDSSGDSEAPDQQQSTDYAAPSIEDYAERRCGAARSGSLRTASSPAIPPGSRERSSRSPARSHRRAASSPVPTPLLRPSRRSPILKAQIEANQGPLDVARFRRTASGTPKAR